MSEPTVTATTRPRGGRRLALRLLTFVLLGPLVGSLVAYVVYAGLLATSTDGGSPGLIEGFVIMAGLGYVMGLLPALLSGVTMPGRSDADGWAVLRWVGFSAVLAIVFTAFGLGSPIVMVVAAVAGAVAAPACRWVATRLGLLD
jgi:hypothetical protein